MPANKSSQLLRYRREKLKAVRRTRWQVNKKAGSSTSPTREVPRFTRGSQFQSKLDQNYIINLSVLLDGLRTCCHCHAGPLSIVNIAKPPVQIGLGVVLPIKCSNCQNTCRIKTYKAHRTGARGPATPSLNTQAVLSTLHTGQGSSHLNGTLSVLGLGSLSNRTFKKREREAGLGIEEVCKESCKKFKEEEKCRSEISDGEGNALISVSYDGAWQKRGKARNSLTGFGTVVGDATGKILDYRVKSTRCRFCEASISDESKPHDCRKNHTGSSKSMEPEIAVECFNDAPSCGMKYSTYTADEDTTTESHVNYRVTYETSKKTDRNHASRTLGSRLYAAQKSVKGLTQIVITYIQKLFVYCVAKNQGKPEEIKSGLETLVCHAFGDHAKCNSTWCLAKKNPAQFKFKDLPGGKPLSGDNLRAAIEDALSPFKTDEWTKKLANCGSSQRNESANGLVATKAPKTRYYGGSESLNFRVAAGVSQFNEGLPYLKQTTDQLKLDDSEILTKFVEQETRKRKRHQSLKKKWSFKRRRKELKKTRSKVKDQNERKEGATYETGIAVTEEGTALSKGVLTETLSSFDKDDLDKIDGLVTKANPGTVVAPVNDNHVDEVYECFALDLETTGLKRDSEIIQIACASCENSRKSFSQYSVPDGNISSSAAKVNRLSTSFRSGKKVLLKDSKIVGSISCKESLDNFVQFLEENNSDRRRMILIAHNGDTFDYTILCNSLIKYSLFDRINSLNILFLDSLKIFPRVYENSTKSLSLPNIYNSIFSKGFDAHDAMEDVHALIHCLDAVLPNMNTDIGKFYQDMRTLPKIKSNVDQRSAIRQTVLTMHSLPVSNSMKEKIAKAGIDFTCLKKVFASYGSRGLIALLTAPASSTPRVTKNRRVLGSITNFFEKEKNK